MQLFLTGNRSQQEKTVFVSQSMTHDSTSRVQNIREGKLSPAKLGLGLSLAKEYLGGVGNASNILKTAIFTFPGGWVPSGSVVVGIGIKANTAALEVWQKLDNAIQCSAFAFT